jgi:hypothetical protein
MIEENKRPALWFRLSRVPWFYVGSEEFSRTLREFGPLPESRGDVNTSDGLSPWSTPPSVLILHLQQRTARGTAIGK